MNGLEEVFNRRGPVDFVLAGRPVSVVVEVRGALPAGVRTYWKRNSGAYLCAKAMFSGVGAARTVNARKAIARRLGMEVWAKRNVGRRAGPERNA